MPQSLWDFAVDRYSRPGVAELCLALQDQQGADVCLLLAALWLEQRGVAPIPARVALLARVATAWQMSVTTPLRELRRAWKEAAVADADLAELRQELATLELKAERRLLERLEKLAVTWTATANGATVRWLEPLAATWASAAPATGRATLQRLRDAAATVPQP